MNLMHVSSQQFQIALGYRFSFINCQLGWKKIYGLFKMTRRKSNIPDQLNILLIVEHDAQRHWQNIFLAQAYIFLCKIRKHLPPVKICLGQPEPGN